MNMCNIVAGLPGGCSLSAISEHEFDGQWVEIPKQVLRSAVRAAFQPAGAIRWLALERYLPWWPRPVFGSTGSIPEAEYFLVLWEREDGRCGVALPLVDGNLRGVLIGGAGGWSMRTPQYDPVPDHATLLFVATGNDPVALVQWAVGRIEKRMGTFRLRPRKAAPMWVDYFGWCTWDAFYSEVSTEKVLEGLASFQRGGISPHVLILDGGWQQEKDEQLWSFDARPDQFPGGLKPLVDQARTNYGVKIFAAWHTLQGYWNGVHPDGELGKRYRLVHTEGIAYNMSDSGVKQRSLVHPDDIGRFFDDYHRTLKEQGVNMVKVDNQAALDHFGTPDLPPTTTMRAYQSALQDSELANFRGESLHCMSHSTDLAYDLKSAVAWRSSQDFFPDKQETQALHIFDNAFNSVWVQTFALPDWDMFQSSHPAAEFHAAARAISGGPVYVSDKPGQHDFALLSKLVVSGGRVLRSKQPALPARDGFFEDGRTMRRVTKIVNHNDVDGINLQIGVLGLFNCYYNKTMPEAVSGEYCAADVPGMTASRFALYHHFGGHVSVAEANRRFPVRLKSLGCELVTVSPLERGVALFGLIDKFNGSRAIAGAHWVNDDELELVLADGGRVGWHSERRIHSATCMGTGVEVDSRESLAWARLPEGAPTTLLLRFG